MFPSTIRKRVPISSGPVVFAGSSSGTVGSNNATGTSASFNNPTWIVGGNGTYYVSDTGNHVIRKIVTQGLVGVVTTVFGTAGTSGSSLSLLNSPRGIAIDASSNLYVADYSNNRVLKIPYGSSTGSNMGTVSNVVRIATNSNGSNVIAVTDLSGKNMYQFRNGTLDGQINANYTSNSGFSYIGLNSTAITCSPSGSFYWSLTPNQFQNQVGMYRMGTLQAPTTVTTSMTITYPYTLSGGGFDTQQNPVCLVTVGSITNITAGTQFTILNATPGTDLYNYQGTVLIINIPSSNTFAFKWSPTLKYPTGKPNPEAYISNNTYNSGTSYSNIIAIGYDSFLGYQTPGLFSPQDRRIINFYFASAADAFPSIAAPSSNSTGNSPGYLSSPPSGPATAFLGFTGIFSNYNLSSTRTADITIYDVDCGYSSASVTPGYRTYFTLGITSGSSVTQQYTGRAGGGILNLAPGNASYLLRGPGVPDGTIITVDTITAYDPVYTYLPIAGTITLNQPITSVATSGAYYVTTWPYSAGRIVRADFGATGGPTISTDSGGLTYSSVLVNNSSNGVSVNGAYYGYYISNIQFSPNSSSIFYSSGAGVVTKYSVSGDAMTSTSSLTTTGTYSVPSFSILDTLPTSEIIGVVPNSSSNRVDIYNNRY